MNHLAVSRTPLGPLARLSLLQLATARLWAMSLQKKDLEGHSPLQHDLEGTYVWFCADLLQLSGSVNSVGFSDFWRVVQEIRRMLFVVVFFFFIHHVSCVVAVFF